MQENGGEVIAPSEQRQLVARILASELFAKSHRLAAFLKFICEQSIEGNASSINEQRIGTEVFGRRQGYHVGEDSIVRSQARFLRQRLEEYFATEGRDEPYILTIPKGSYLPSFERREIAGKLAVFPSAPAPARTPEISRVLRSPRLRNWVLTAIACALVAAGLVVVLQERSVKPSPQETEAPAVAAFWSSIFSSKGTTLIVTSDSSLVLLEELLGKPIHLLSYINKDYMKLPPVGSPALWQSLLSSDYTNMADLNLVAHLERVREAANGRSEIRYARDLSMKELKEANAILIGGPRSNPWTELFSSAIDFDVDHDFATGYNVVRNLAPAAGEQSLYVENTTGTADTNRAYGVVVYAPGLDNVGHILLVEGTSKPGTEAAGEFLTSPAFAFFLEKIGATGSSVPNFQVLLSTSSMNGTSYSPSIVSWHRLRKPASN